MGKTLMGSTQVKGNVSMLTPEQQKLMSDALGQLGPQFLESFSSLLQPMGEEQMQDIFQTSYVEPAQQALQRDIIPGIQQSFADLNASGSSALNRALAQSATDLSTSLGSQYGQFVQGQQQQQLGALSQFLPLLGQQTFSPIIQQRSGLAGPLLQAIGSAGAAYAASSKDVKENIKDYNKGLDELEKLKVKQYDYTEAVDGSKDRVGLLAEDVPVELTKEIDGILHVDLYGVLGMLVNSVKDLSKQVKKLQEA